MGDAVDLAAWGDAAARLIEAAGDDVAGFTIRVPPDVLATLVAVARAVRRRRAIVARLETIADQSAQQRAHAAAVIIREIDEATQALNAALAPVIDTATREDG